MADAAAEVARYTRQDLEGLVSSGLKAFCKLKCAECGAVACKRFSAMMPVMVPHMLDSCWCNECGRLLCEKDRYRHTCERLDQQKERNKHLTKEQLAAQLAEAEALRAAAEEERRLEQRAAAEAAEAQRVQRKDRRRLLAAKARCVEGFLQSITRDTEANGARGVRVRDELCELYTRSRRLSLTLYNEYEHPTLPGLAEDEWAELKEVYSRARELSGMIAVMEEGPLDLRNPWDPPPAAQDQEQPGAGAEPGLGRGLL